MYNTYGVEISNVVVKWLALLLLILEVPGSDVGQETGYSE
jgi:hypothetical protein